MIRGFHTLSQRWQLWADISCGQWYYQVKHKKLFVGAIIIIIITGREQQKSAASTVQSFQELTQSQLEGDCATAWLFSIGLDIRWWRWWWCCVSIWSPPTLQHCSYHIFKHHKDHVWWAISGRRRGTLLVTGARRCGLIRRERWFILCLCFFFSTWFFIIVLLFRLLVD